MFEPKLSYQVKLNSSFPKKVRNPQNMFNLGIIWANDNFYLKIQPLKTKIIYKETQNSILIYELPSMQSLYQILF